VDKPLRLFQNDYITSFKLKKNYLFFAPILNIFLSGWSRKRLAMKVVAPKLQCQKVLFPIIWEEGVWPNRHITFIMAK